MVGLQLDTAISKIMNEIRCRFQLFVVAEAKCMWKKTTNVTLFSFIDKLSGFIDRMAFVVASILWLMWPCHMCTFCQCGGHV